MTSALRMFSPVLVVFVAALHATRRRLVRQLERADAVGPEAAIPLSGTSPLFSWWKTRLTAANVIMVEGPDRYWLDLGAWQHYREGRRRRGIIVLSILIVTIAILLALGVFKD